MKRSTDWFIYTKSIQDQKYVLDDELTLIVLQVICQGFLLLLSDMMFQNCCENCMDNDLILDWGGFMVYFGTQIIKSVGSKTDMFTVLQ